MKVIREDVLSRFPLILFVPVTLAHFVLVDVICAFCLHGNYVAFIVPYPGCTRKWYSTDGSETIWEVLSSSRFMFLTMPLMIADAPQWLPYPVFLHLLLGPTLGLSLCSSDVHKYSIPRTPRKTLLKSAINFPQHMTRITRRRRAFSPGRRQPSLIAFALPLEAPIILLQMQHRSSELYKFANMFFLFEQFF